MAVQLGPTSIHVIWATVPIPRDTIGFRIYYRGPVTGSVDVDDIETRNFVLTGLKNNATYTVSIAAKSVKLPSERVQADPVKLGERERGEREREI